MERSETREIVEKAIKGFFESMDPDERLSYLWKISQLVEDTTDDELYELATAVAAEDDPRLRGEICYTISRSQRPHLVRLVKDMTNDSNQYVRYQAINAVRELGGLDQALLLAVEPLIKALDELRETVKNLEKQLTNIGTEIKNFQEYNDNAISVESLNIDQRARSWETYLRNEGELLKNHRGKFVAIYGDEIIAIDDDDERLAQMVLDKYGQVEFVIFKIEEEQEEPIHISPYVNIVEI